MRIWEDADIASKAYFTAREDSLVVGTIVSQKEGDCHLAIMGAPALR